MDLEYLRQFRIGQFTIFDTATAYIGILIIAPLLTWIFSKIKINIPIISWLWFTLPISVIFHIIFRQSTPLMKMLVNPADYKFYIAAILLLSMTYMGIKKISKK